MSAAYPLTVCSEFASRSRSSSTASCRSSSSACCRRTSSAARAARVRRRRSRFTERMRSAPPAIMQRPVVVVRRRRPLTPVRCRSVWPPRSRSPRSASGRSSPRRTSSTSSLARFEGQPTLSPPRRRARAGAGDPPRRQGRPAAAASRLRPLTPRRPLMTASPSPRRAAPRRGLVTAACGGFGAPSAEEYSDAVVLNREPRRLRPRPHHPGQLDRRAPQPDGRGGGRDLRRPRTSSTTLGAPDDFSQRPTISSTSLNQLAIDVQATADQARVPGFEGLLTETNADQLRQLGRGQHGARGARRQGDRGHDPAAQSASVAASLVRLAPRHSDRLAARRADSAA